MDMNELRDPDKLREYMIDEELPKAIPFKTEKAFDPNGLSYLKGVGNEYKILPLLNVGNNNEVRLSINVFRGMEPKSFMKPCLGMGDDILSSLRNAIDTARIALFPALQRMLEHDAYSSIETEFEGKKHSWKVYAANVYTRKDNVTSESEEEVAKILDRVMPDIVKRLGNQKFMNVFLRFSNTLTACLFVVNDIYAITEPLDKFMEIANEYPGTVKELCLIIEQDASTHFSSVNFDGQRDVRMLNEYLDMLRNTPDAELSDSEFEDAKLLIGDPTFVNCCRAFLPELAATVMIPREIRYSDYVEVYTADGIKHDICLTQQDDFLRIRTAVYQVFGKSRGQDPIFRTLSDRSQIVRYLQETRMPPSERILIENYRFKFHMGEGFEFR